MWKIELPMTCETGEHFASWVSRNSLTVRSLENRWWRASSARRSWARMGRPPICTCRMLSTRSMSWGPRGMGSAQSLTESTSDGTGILWSFEMAMTAVPTALNSMTS